MRKLKVLELFAGVGGFRIGLEKTNKFKVVWSNQYEPRTSIQHASMVYENKFGKKNHSRKDISKIKVNEIPKKFDVLVGGFPCQDYSVANSLQTSSGIEGKKGVLWWEIDRLLREFKSKPKFLILENVDRLLKSPASQRGRDFAIMLKCLSDLNYAVEWRVINAADYGFPQKRKRVFILGYHKSTNQFKLIKKNNYKWLINNGVLIKSFPISDFSEIQYLDLSSDSLIDVSNNFNKGGKNSLFKNSGVMINNEVITSTLIPKKSNFGGEIKFLKDVLEKNKVSDEFYIKSDDLANWKKHKDAKKEPRVAPNGFKYIFSEGKMSFPDNIDKPSRTIITSEGGKGASRTKHIIKDKYGYRRLTPIELERLNGFDDNHTMLEGISNSKRAFFMGNALVVGIVERIGNNLLI